MIANKNGSGLLWHQIDVSLAKLGNKREVGVSETETIVVQMIIVVLMIIGFVIMNYYSRRKK